MKSLGTHFGSLAKLYPNLTSLVAVAALIAIGTTHSALGAEKTVTMHDNSFAPPTLSVQPGDSVTWLHQGNVLHTTTSSTPGIWNSGLMTNGNSFSFTFNNEGSFPYFCQVHPQEMTGTITVSAATAGPTNDLFLINLTGKAVTTNASGIVTTAPQRTVDFIKDCAGDSSRNPADLALVYNVQADAIVVVDRNDGSTVCTFATFTGGVTIPSPDGSQMQRQAFVLWEDSTAPNGSMTATVMAARNDSGELTKLTFRGTIQVGIPAYDNESSKIFQGTFATGRRFAVRVH